MKRLLSTLYLDVKLQFRNGFYYVTAFVTIAAALAITQLPFHLDLSALLPAIVLNDLPIGTFYFIGGLVLLEKGEGTLAAQVVTPLRTWEYLVSKVITLSVLSVLQNLVIVGLLYGPRLNVLAFVLGVLAGSALYTLGGFLVVARYASINEYLMPSILYVLVFSLPLLPYFGIGQSAWFYWHPMQTALTLMQGGFQPLEWWQWLYGVGYAALALGVLYRLCERTFVKFIVTVQV